ncbi:MAG: hydantoinase/oxoprolinase family protein [Nitrospiraceae bacterium]|nr:hydantoinase/oxoprolinase family protein [Nitrospiraceae bacterium]
MGILVNVDNGGTFTDVCASDGARIVHAKTPTTPHDLTQCFLEGLRKASERLYGEEDLSRLLRDTDHLRYSTTSGTNAVVERKGAPVALLVESGEEDALYGLGATSASDLWRAMVPARPVGIRLGKDGSFGAEDFTVAINSLIATNASRIVIVLRSLEVERAVKAELLARYPRHLLGAIPFTLSHELAGDDDHARRAVTAVINSYLHPGMEHFLYGAEKGCKTYGLTSPLLIFRNDGDSARVAKTTAVKTWGSGPRGGLEGAVAYAGLYEVPVLVGMDVGGTTTDISVVENGSISVLAHGKVDSASISFPIPEIRSIGLGGSSVVEVSEGRIRIGPRSVGAVPGPACFGRGGTAATLTDALLLAGILDPDRYLGGELRLDAARAAAALSTHVGQVLSLSTEAAALAVLRAFEEEAGRALRAILEGLGRDPREAAVLAFGGAGPVVATGIAAAAGIGRVIVPQLSSVFSAFGIGFSGLAHEYSVPMPADALRARAARDEMLARARQDMFGEGVPADGCSYETMSRLVENGVVRDISWANGSAPPGAEGAARLVVRGSHPLATFELARDENRSNGAIRADGSRRVLLGAGDPADVPLHRQESIVAGASGSGPAVVAGDYLTCLIEQGWKFRVSSNGDLIMEVEE